MGQRVTGLAASRAARCGSGGVTGSALRGGGVAGNVAHGQQVRERTSRRSRRELVSLPPHPRKPARAPPAARSRIGTAPSAARSRASSPPPAASCQSCSSLDSLFKTHNHQVCMKLHGKFWPCVLMIFQRPHFMLCLLSGRPHASWLSISSFRGALLTLPALLFCQRRGEEVGGKTRT